MSQRPAQLDAQLRSMAAAIDRANRPVALLALPATALALCLVYLVWAALGVRAAGTTLERERAQESQVVALVEAIQNERTAAVDIVDLYGPQPYFSSRVDELAKLPELGFRNPPVVDRARTTMEIPEQRIQRSDVPATIQMEDLDAVLKWIDLVLSDEQFRGGVFLSQARLSPVGPGWGSNLRFTLYEVPTDAAAARRRTP